MQEKLAETIKYIKSNQIIGGSENSLAETLVQALRQNFGDIISTGNTIYYCDKDLLWKPIDDTSLCSITSAFDRRVLGKTFKISMSAAKARGVIQFLKLSPQILDQTFFDTPLSGIAFTNTVLIADKDGIQQVAPSKVHRLRTCLPFNYETTIQPTKWLELLDQIFLTDVDKAQKISALQEFLGMCMINRITQCDKCLICVGAGANGKSTLIDAIQLLMSKSAFASIPPQKWEDEYYISLLDGKVFNLVSELPESAILHTDKFKSIVTGDSVMARSPYESPRTIKPIAGHIFATNELPHSDDNSDGFWRRFLVFSFNQTFKNQQGKTRRQILAEIQPEVPAIVYWCLEGAVRRLNQAEFTEIPSHQVTLDTWRLESDSVAAWAKNHAKPIDINQEQPLAAFLKINGWKSAGVRSFYVKWCEAEGYRPVGARKLKRRLEALGYLSFRITDGTYWAIKITVHEDPIAPHQVESKPN